MVVDPGLAGLVTAGTGLLVVATGYLISRRGQQDTAAQQDLAHEVMRDKVSLDQTTLAVATYVGLVDTLRGEAARVTVIADQMRIDLADERRDHATDSAAYGLIEARCRVQSATLVEALNVLQTVVVNETALQLIRRTRGQMTEHPHNPVVVQGEIAP